MAVLESTSYSRALFAWLPQNFLSSIVQISFPHIYWPMQGMPFCPWIWRCMSYSMPSGENKENKAYSRWIFFNLRPNEIARIIENLQKGTFVPIRGLMSKSNIISRISIKKKCQWVQKPVWKTATNDVLWLSGPKVLLKAEFEGTPGLLAQAGSIFLDSHARRKQFEYLWVRHGLLMSKLWPF